LLLGLLFDHPSSLPFFFSFPLCSFYLSISLFYPYFLVLLVLILLPS
jgi:hypothetical protein